MTNTTISLRLTAEEKALISECATTYGVSVSEFLRESVLERIEDEFDLRVWDEAKAEFESDPTTLTAAEIAAKYL
ncbi:type II toxin-antitoxin system RelB family antitoxin [Propionimicrobium sp. PCR01-08-3]|uniref:type II toxin-antitoxin system RelB family antitoxin n=1 Tax=Propionimicrobium sp. PCR01-08-3 TaxID=3052086 RepID=UPI00255C78A3|nr:DUF6290 family protein [Propionimicrobium sp. PCR01-08-3]WIY83290.1 DUF6290 family protein [Propionimicrobium sp. PCR01-08-3]